MSSDLQFSVSDPNGLRGPMETDQSVAASESRAPTGLSASAHPIVCVVHFLFKGCALFLYIFGGWFVGSGEASGANFITITVMCILLLAVDFWVVKNITGRLLVGLRWWNQVEGDSTKWIFESANERAVNKFDHSVFWTVLYATPVIWGALFVIGILKFEIGWLITVVMAIALSASNVYGYYKCSSDQKAKFQQMMIQGAEAGAMTAIRSNLFSFIVGRGGVTQAARSDSAPTTTYV